MHNTLCLNKESGECRECSVGLGASRERERVGNVTEFQHRRAATLILYKTSPVTHSLCCILMIGSTLRLIMTHILSSFTYNAVSHYTLSFIQSPYPVYLVQMIGRKGSLSIECNSGHIL